jgi:hypothetical protein
MMRDLVNLVLQVQRDEQRPDAALRQRDRAIGRQLTKLSTRPRAQLMAWLEQVAENEDTIRARQVATALRCVTSALLGFGLIAGGGAAAAVFYYNGKQPINILPVLAVFVALPLLLLIPFILATLPYGLTRRLPGLSSVQESLSLLSAGLIAVTSRLLPQQYRDALQQALGQATAHQRVYGRVQKWLLVRWKQWFAVAFHIGAIAWFGYLIVSRDLAFTWSTTLDVQEQQVQQISRALAMPWATLWPEARPDDELIRATHYFRVQEHVLTEGVSPAVLGRWWRFLLAAMIAYGLLPRLATLLWCTWRFTAAMHWSLLHIPGVTDVLDRLHTIVIETRSPNAEQEGEAAASAPATAIPGEVQTTVGRTCIAINWSEVPLDERALTVRIAMDLGFAVEQIYQAGGISTLDQDRRIIDHVYQAVTSNPSPLGTVVVAVKAWEPPVMDFVDFVRDLRAKLGDGLRIIVAPLCMNTNRPAVSAPQAFAEQWQRHMQTIGDPWLSVRSLHAVDMAQHAADATGREPQP